jgi:hypothetical protein
VRWHKGFAIDHMIRAIVAIALLCAADVLNPLKAAEKANEQDLAHFESRIRPVLVRHCYECHSHQAGKAEGSLVLDTRAGIRRGGDRGPAVVPGEPAKSILLAAISHAHDDLKMPPKKARLPDGVIADFRRWIEQGAADPREVEATTATRQAIDYDAARQHWALKKPLSHSPPVTSNPGWARRELDHFVLAKLDAAGLKPAQKASDATLLRRLYFDLVGLPPSPEEVQSFESGAYEQVVDRLLSSPQFGERWGRHWLDVARFAESSGKEANISFPYAWRYRDYVIDAVNADVPFDRFITEQLAGDLLPYDSDEERSRLLIATGFLALGPKNLDEMNALQFTADLVDEQIDTVTRAFTASSVACARCHHHKFDPYSMEDYYALAGVFASTKTFFGTFVSPANRMGGDPLVLPREAGLPILHKSISAKEVAELKAKLAALKAEKPTDLREALRVFWTSGGLEGQLEKVDDEGRALPLAMGVLDRETIGDAPLLERGEVGRPAQVVARALPKVIELTDAPQPSSRQSGRLELAHWLTHPDHPLTARVFVNRVWRHLFGAGLVRTVDNFGITGEAPSHPELLDSLAVRFMAEGWSLKKLVREIVLSSTYRQAATYREEAFKADPDNRWLWRVPPRRLEAEAIRDAMLVASGELDLKRPVGSLVGREIGDRPISLIGLDSRLPADLDGSVHRSVYLPVLRDRLPDVLDLFDFAEPSLVTGDRETTNVPVQALYLMNSPFVQARAKALAARLAREAESEEERIRRGFLLCYSRQPTDKETAAAERFLKQATKGETASDEAAWAALCQALLCTAEFRNID